MFRFFRNRRRIEYTQAERIEEEKEPIEYPEIEPLKDRAGTYIRYIQKLKQAMIAGNVKTVSFVRDKYLPSVGLGSPSTITECDALIEEVKKWQYERN